MKIGGVEVADSKCTFLEFEPFNWYTWRTTHYNADTTYCVCVCMVWASGYYVGSRSRPPL